MTTNAEAIFEPLYRSGIVTYEGINERALINMNFKDLLDIYDDVASISSGYESLRSVPGRLHSASPSLGGSPSECSSRKCRLERVDELARFSALYSDHVLFSNFLSEISPSFGHPPKNDSDMFRERALNDIHVITKIKPLIETGILIPYTMDHSYCVGCFAKKYLGSKTSTKARQSKESIAELILESCESRILYRKGKYIIQVRTKADVLLDGAFDIFPHSLYQETFSSPKESIKKLLCGKTTKELSAEEFRSINLHKKIAQDLISDAIYQKTIAKLTGAEIVTHNNSEIKALSYIDDVSNRTINKIIEDTWDLVVPFAADVSISDLATLRDREGDSFVRFRSALDKSIREASSNGSGFGASQARELFSDVIQPELSRLNLKVNEAKKSLITKPLTSAIGVVATLGIGMYTGMLSAELAAAANALGITKISYDAITGFSKDLDTGKEIKQEDYYFLWRVKNLAK